jgi:hypothetical protein
MHEPLAMVQAATGSACRLSARFVPNYKDAPMSMSLLLIIVLIILLIGAFPAWPYGRSWGYRPVGGLGIIVIIVIVLLLLGVF